MSTIDESIHTLCQRCYKTPCICGAMYEHAPLDHVTSALSGLLKIIEQRGHKIQCLVDDQPLDKFQRELTRLPDSKAKWPPDEFLATLRYPELWIDAHREYLKQFTDIDEALVKVLVDTEYKPAIPAKSVLFLLLQQAVQDNATCQQSYYSRILPELIKQIFSDILFPEDDKKIMALKFADITTRRSWAVQMMSDLVSADDPLATKWASAIGKLTAVDDTELSLIEAFTALLNTASPMVELDKGLHSIKSSLGFLNIMPINQLDQRICQLLHSIYF